MPIQRECAVADAVRLNEFAWSLTLDVGEDMARAASCGQFVHLKCGEERLLRRPISICDRQEGFLRVVFEVRGEGTAWLAGRKAGDRLNVLGPLGRGFDVSGKKLLVVGGGIGVPPMLGCAKAAAGRGSEVYAALGFRDMGHQMLTAEFSRACAGMEVISDDGSTGRQGFVTGLVAEYLALGGFDTVLACGPKPMLRAVAGEAEKRGVECQVSLEERMGCGVGACLVCACKTADGHMAHVCKDGPVFRAEEVDWDD